VARPGARHGGRRAPAGGEHLRACRLAARRPAGLLALTPGEEANRAEAFEEIDRVLHGAAGRERLEAVWAQLPAAV
jgi:hypothetical protein